MNTLVDMRGVTRHYKMGHHLPWQAQRVLRAVDGISLTVARGETLGIVGESGSGKSTLGQLALGMVAPSHGSVLFNGEIVANAGTPAWRKLRREMQMLFQDPLGALNPRLTIGQQIEEPLIIHGIGDAGTRAAKIHHYLDAVHLRRSFAERYPHELSGGQRQRVVLARALILEPKLIVCDEPVSALDVSVQAQIVNLLGELKQQFDLTMLFISHDLRIVRHVSDRIAVMYLGRIVEIGERHELFNAPQHPYSQALIAAVPEIRAGGERRARTRLPGEPPSPMALPAGCRFRSRCARASALCAEREPELVQVGSTAVACHYPGPTVETKTP